MADPRVSVVIINFNSGQYIFKCLEHVQAQTYPNIETMVVDNASSDGSSATLAHMAETGGIRYHRSDVNWGSSRANNYGIHQTSGDFVLVLNADAFLNPDYIERCVTAFAAYPEAGSVVGKLVSTHDSSFIDSAGITLFREGIALDRGMREKDHGQYDHTEYVAGACCAAAVYRRSMLDDLRVGDEYYDEDFFAFYEDVDLSVRALLLGWKTLYIPDAVAHHVRGACLAKSSRFAEFLAWRNMQLFYLKTFENGDLIGAVLRRLLYWVWSHTATGTPGRDDSEKLRTDLFNLSGKILMKRRTLSTSSDYARLKPYCRKSYIVHTLSRRVARLVGH